MISSSRNVGISGVPAVLMSSVARAVILFLISFPGWAFESDAAPFLRRAGHRCPGSRGRAAQTTLPPLCGVGHHPQFRPVRSPTISSPRPVSASGPGSAAQGRPGPLSQTMILSSSGRRWTAKMMAGRVAGGVTAAMVAFVASSEAMVSASPTRWFSCQQARATRVRWRAWAAAVGSGLRSARV